MRGSVERGLALLLVYFIFFVSLGLAFVFWSIFEGIWLKIWR